MTLVDTSVWIEFFKGGDHWSKERLKAMIHDRESIAYIDYILLEIIQGVRERTDREQLNERFESYVLLKTGRSTVLLAAEIYQEIQRKGFRIRSIVDGLIAATAIETGCQVLHKDRDFDRIAEFYPLKVVQE